MVFAALGTALALVAGEASAQYGNSNLFTNPTGGPASVGASTPGTNLPDNLVQPGIGGNTVKELAGNGPAPGAAAPAAPGVAAGGAPAAGAPAVAGPAAGAQGIAPADAGAATAPVAGGAAVGGAAVGGAAVGGAAVGGAAVTNTTAVAGVALGLSTVNPTTILGNFNNGFGGPFGFNQFPNGQFNNGQFNNGQFNNGQFNQPSCGNVIDLVVRHCIGNRLFNNNNGQNGFNPFFGNAFVPNGQNNNNGFNPFFGNQQVVDLELIAVNIVTEAGPSAGPIYQVTFRNNSQFSLQNFRITLVAVLGTINEWSPNVTVNAPCVKAGEVATIQVTLPANVMQMGVASQPLVAFDTLVVALDSFDQIPETNECNNIAVLKRVGIPIVAVTSATTPVAGAAIAGPAVAGPAVGGAAVGGAAVGGTVAPGTAVAPNAALAPAAPANPATPANPVNPTAPAPGPSVTTPNGGAAGAPVPGDAAVPKPTEKINLDNLDLGDMAVAAKPVGQ
jgi:hypothetical protein